jgi:hypothetical protein
MSKHKNKALHKPKQSKKPKEILWWIMATAVVAGIVYVAMLAEKRPPSSITTREVAMTCTTDMATVYHVHPTIAILISGVPQTIPTNVGIKPGCMYALHTHENTGLIHIESPEKRDFTLGDFFAVWKKPFSSTQLFDQIVDDAHVIRVTVDGEPVDTFENTILHDKDKIEISYEAKS